MHELITDLSNVGQPNTKHITSTKIKVPNYYYVTWYKTAHGLSYHALGHPVLIASCCLLARNPKLTTDSILSKLKVADTLKHHIEFAQSALTQLDHRL